MISLKSALEKLKPEIDAKRQKEILTACQVAIDALPTDEQAQKSPLEEVVFWSPFKLCCNPLLPTKLRELTLDIIQKLFANSSLRGSQIIDYPIGEPMSSSDKQQSRQQDKGKLPDTSSKDSANSADKPQTASYPPLLIDDVIHCVIMATPLSSLNDASPNSAESNVHLQIIKVLLTAVTSPTIEVHESTLLKAIQACINIWLYSKNLVNQTTAKASVTQMIHAVFTRMEKSFEDLEKKESSSSSSTANEATVADTSSAPVTSHIIVPEAVPENNPYRASKEFYHGLLVRDAYFVLRLLAKFAMKTDRTPTSSSSRDTDELSQTMIKTRAIALEMIMMVMNNSGPALQFNESFVSIVRSIVTSAVSKNGLLTQPALFELALSIFLIILKTYKSPLKPEIEILFNEIYLYILDNSNSTYKQKSMVLNGLFKLCSNPQMLVDVYVNYDCDMNTVSIYERIISCLAKIAQGSGVKIGKFTGVFGISDSSHSNIDPLILQERKLRAKAVRCLTSIVSSLGEWMRESPVATGISLVVAAQEMGIRSLDEVEKQLKAGYKTPISESSESSREEVKEEKRNSNPISPPSSVAPTIIPNKNHLESISMADNMLRRGNRSSVALIEGMDSLNSNNSPEEFEKVKTKKSLLKQGIAKFNEKPGKGILFLKEVGFLSSENSCESIVKFLRFTPELSKTAIGDFIGEGKEENITIMHKFVESFDFTDIEFVVSLRKFLQAFRLPGEAQKIDRIMEKFAAQYCSTNQKIFAKADTAYTLAFSIMMLNTDLHSPKIKNKMSKMDFIRNNRGINDNGDLPDEFLSNIFDNIYQNEIVLEEERTIKELEKMLSVGVSVTGRELDLQRREFFKRETKNIEKKSLNLIKKGKDRILAPFRSATHVDHARPMFELLWPPLMASVSTVFEECIADDFPINQDSYLDNTFTDLPVGETNTEVITLCLIAFNTSVKISCLFKMDTERDAFISSLAKLSCLNDVSQMKSKNVAAAKIIINSAIKLGNYLENSWKPVLKCISDMDKWQIIGEGSVLIDNSQSPRLSTDSRSVSVGKTLNGEINAEALSPTTADVKAMQLRRPSLAKLTAQFHTQHMVITIDKIFSNSVTLDGSSILHFYESLCAISSEEIESSRIYSLQKVVEISYYNMQRIRLEWTQIWKILTSFFNNVGCHSNLGVATYAVDSLRQLGMKFLMRDELAHFTTNNEFMKPFEHIMRHSTFIELKDLVVQSLNQMVSARARNIKSGWRSIFVVLSRIAIDQPDIHLIGRAFKMLSEILGKYWDLMNEFLVDYANCLVDFALISEKNSFFGNENENIIEAAIILLLETSDKLASFLNDPLIDDDFYLKWFPILSGLSRIQRDSTSASIRAKSLDTFFEILLKHGQKFSFERKHWKTIIKSVMLPLFEDLKFPLMSLPSSEDSSMRMRISIESGQSAIWIQALRRMIEVYTKFYVKTDMEANECFRENLELVTELIDLILLLIKRNSQNLAHTGVIYLGEFLKQNALQFDMKSWNMVISSIEEAFQATIPTELLRFPTSSVTKPAKPMTDIDAESEAKLIESIDVPHAVLKCATHLLVLEFVRDLALEKLDEASAIIKSGTFQDGSQDEQQNLYILPFPTEIFQKLDHVFQQRLLSCLHASHVFGKAFNENLELRMSLLKAGAVPQMPYLIKQETQSMATYLTILFHMYRFTGDVTTEKEQDATSSLNILSSSKLVYRQYHFVLDCLVKESIFILENYLHLMNDPVKYSRELNSWAMVVCLIWKEIVTIPWGKQESGRDYSRFKLQIPILFRIAIRMIAIDRSDVKYTIQDFMQKMAHVVEKEEFLHLL